MDEEYRLYTIDIYKSHIWRYDNRSIRKRESPAAYCSELSLFYKFYKLTAMKKTSVSSCTIP